MQLMICLILKDDVADPVREVSTMNNSVEYRII
jgi:hypothetical protein